MPHNHWLFFGVLGGNGEGNAEVFSIQYSVFSGERTSETKGTWQRADGKAAYFAAFFLVGFVFEGLAFAVFLAALAAAISANTFSIRRI